MIWPSRLTLFGIPYFHSKIPPKKFAESPRIERISEAVGINDNKKGGGIGLTRHWVYLVGERSITPPRYTPQGR
jgi:hypothetical protein